MESYLRISSPFSDLSTERLIHPGALVGPRADPVLLVARQVSHLRLVVADWVNVVKGSADGDAVEVFGNLQAGDLVVRMEQMKSGKRSSLLASKENCVGQKKSPPEDRRRHFGSE